MTDSDSSQYSEISYHSSSSDGGSWDEILIEGAEDRLYNTMIKLCQIENSNVTIEASNEYLRLEVAEAEKFKKKYVDYLVKGLEKASSNLQVDYLGCVKEYLEEKRLIEQDHEAKDLISILINDDSVYNKAKEIILERKKKATESLDAILIKSDKRLNQFSTISSIYRGSLVSEDKRIELFEEAKNNLIEQFPSLSKQEQFGFIENQAEYKKFLSNLNEDQLDAVKRGDKLVQAILSDSVLNEALTNIDQSSQKDPFFGVAKRGSGQSSYGRGSSHSRGSGKRVSKLVREGSVNSDTPLGKMAERYREDSNQPLEPVSRDFRSIERRLSVAGSVNSAITGTSDTPSLHEEGGNNTSQPPAIERAASLPDDGLRKPPTIKRAASLNEEGNLKSLYFNNTQASKSRTSNLGANSCKNKGSSHSRSS